MAAESGCRLGRAFLAAVSGGRFRLSLVDRFRGAVSWLGFVASAAWRDRRGKRGVANAAMMRHDTIR